MNGFDSESQSGRRARTWTRPELAVSILFLVVIIAGVYGPVVTHDFSNWDDPKHMNAVWRPGWERAWRIVTDFDLRYTGVSYYTPVYFLSLMADQVVVGSESEAQAWIAKLMNVVFHMVNTVLVFALFNMMGVGRRAAFIGALVFAVHPMQVGTVAWITERKNLLATLFYLAGIITFMKYLRSGRAMYAVLLFLLLAGGLLSKPAVVTLPVALLAWILLVPDEKPAGKALYVLMAALFGLAVVWGAYTVSTEVSYEGMLPPLLYRPLLAAGAMGFYLSKFVYPHDLVVVYPKWDIVADAPGFLALFIAFAVVVGLLLYWRKRIDALVLWGLSVFLINVLPVSGLIAFGHMGHSFVADHFVYLPLVGLALVIARAVELLDDGLKDRPHMRNAALICMYGLVCVLSVLAMKQTWLWRDPASLWEATLKVNKTSPAVYNNYAWVLMSRGELDRAIELFKKAAELAPGLEAPYQNLGRIYHSLGNREAARQMFERASALNPRSNFPRIMLGIMLREEGKHEESVEFLKKCVKANPGSALLRIELAQSYYGASRVSEAITELDRAIKLDPLLPGGYVHKAMILLSQGEPEQAAILLEKSIGLGPSAEAHNMLGVAYATRGNLQKAFDEFSKAYGMNPGLSGVRDNVANSLIEMNQLAAAQEFCAEVARLGRPCSEHVLKKLTGKYDRGA